MKCVGFFGEGPVGELRFETAAPLDVAHRNRGTETEVREGRLLREVEFEFADKLSACFMGFV